MERILLTLKVRFVDLSRLAITSAGLGRAGHAVHCGAARIDNSGCVPVCALPLLLPPSPMITLFLPSLSL